MISLSPDLALFKNRNFYIGSSKKIFHLENIGTTFINGFNQAMSANAQHLFNEAIENYNKDLLGFAFEGAAMALTFKDKFTPWNRNRLNQFIHCIGKTHIYMAHVGAGWAFAKLPLNPLKWINQLDPLLKYLSIDGYGFHHGYFKTKQYVYEKRKPEWFTGYNLRVFYQGLGRSLWFVDCADVERISDTINGFPVEIHSDLWSGIGLASSYAGGITEDELRILRQKGQKYIPELAQGAAFAAKARIKAGNLVSHTENACNIFCETSAKEAAEITDEALVDLPNNESKPNYEIWRLRIQKKLSNKLIIA